MSKTSRYGPIRIRAYNVLAFLLIAALSLIAALLTLVIPKPVDKAANRLFVNVGRDLDE